MPDIDIHHTHSLGTQTCRDAVDEVARELASRFGLHDMTWEGDTLSFVGHGVSGRLAVAATDAHVQLQLSPLLGLMRPLIEAEIRQRLHERLG